MRTSRHWPPVIPLQWPRGEMDVFARIPTAAGHEIDFGVATTRAERAAVLAQRFRVYQRHGYYRDGLRVDRDDYDRRAVYFLAALRGVAGADTILGSARLIVGDPHPSFRFPCQRAFQLELPEAIREIPVQHREELSRLVAERPEGIVLAGLVTPLGLIQAVVGYSQRHDIRCGLATIKRRLLRGLQAAGVCLHEIPAAGVISPADGPMSGYYYRHRDPVAPVYWLGDEVVPSIQRAITRSEHRRLPAPA